MFINYNTFTGFSINTCRQPFGYNNWDVVGLVDDVLSNRDGCCPLDGAKAALEDGSLWARDDVTSEVLTEVLEEIHSLICDWEKESQK